MLPKKSGLQNIANWRAISLLCTDDNILSKALATTMQTVIRSNTHWFSCKPNKYIFALIQDLLDVSRLTDIKGSLFSLDQQKAFDRVKHLYLWRTLDAFGFSPGFRAIIEAVYSVLKNNGGWNAPFKVCRGVRQESAMSGMLYSLAVEPLLHKLRRGSCNVHIYIFAHI